jgi:hypothetical protein
MRRLLCASFLLLAVGCDAKKAPDPAAASPAARPLPRRSPPAPGDSSCPRDGYWHRCSLTYALLRGGMGSRVTDSAAAVAWLKPDSAFRIYLGRSELRVFLYKDSTAAERDLRSVDTLTLAPPGAAFPWPSAPTVIRSANLVAVLFDAGAEKMERVQLILTAGAPLTQ